MGAWYILPAYLEDKALLDKTAEMAPPSVQVGLTTTGTTGAADVPPMTAVIHISYAAG